MTKKTLVALLAVTLASCQGPDPVRLHAERKSHAMAVRCADGWFRGLTFTEHDEKLVRDALADWDSAILADEKLLGWTVAR